MKREQDYKDDPKSERELKKHIFARRSRLLEHVGIQNRLGVPRT